MIQPRDFVSFEKLGTMLSKSLSHESIETVIRVPMPRKRRCRSVCGGPVTKGEEGHKKAKLVSPIDERQEQHEITQGEYHQSLQAKWSKLSRQIIFHLGAKEMAALYQELEVVVSSEELSSVVDGKNATATTAAEISSLQALVEELHARNAEQEKRLEELSQIGDGDAQTASITELELESAVQKSVAFKETLEKKITELEDENDKQSKIIGFYGTRIEDLKTRIGELEDCLAATSSESQRADSRGKEIRDEIENTKLKAELTRVLSQLEVAGFQIELGIEKKEEAIAELMALQNQKAIYDAAKAELIELQKQKHMFKTEKTELEELRSLKRTFEAFEAERGELAALRGEKKTFEAVESELKAVSDRLPHQEALLKAAAEELQTLRRQEETFRAAIEELTVMRKQHAVFQTVIEELEKLRTQKEMSNRDRDELELLRRQTATVGPADGEFATFRGGEKANTAKDQILMAKVERLTRKQAKLVSTIKYLEGKTAEDKQKYSQYCLKLEAARTEVHQTSVCLQDVEQQLLSVIKEKVVLQGEKKRLLKEKKKLRCKLRHANKQNRDLQLEMESVKKSETRVEICSTAMNRELFLKEAKIESLKAELRSKQEEDEAGGANTKNMLEEIENLKEVNRSYVDQERELREELNTVSKHLEDATSKSLCRICLKNTGDAVLLPCTHLKGCVRCVKELIKEDKPCTICGIAISGFVLCNFVV